MFSIAQQCALLKLARSSYYYQPVGESADNLALMERIDKLFTARPEMGPGRRSGQAHLSRVDYAR
jgi:putative transposase